MSQQSPKASVDPLKVEEKPNPEAPMTDAKKPEPNKEEAKKADGPANDSANTKDVVGDSAQKEEHKETPPQPQPQPAPAPPQNEEVALEAQMSKQET